VSLVVAIPVVIVVVLIGLVVFLSVRITRRRGSSENR
jgi:hypothetical protein